MQRPDGRQLLHRPWLRALPIVLLVTAASLAPVAAPADAPATRLEGYTARYQVSYRGLPGGEIEASLKPGPAPQIWLYETRAFPNFLGRLAISPSARERGTMEVSADGVKPLEFEFNDGSAEGAKNIRVRFDWSAGRVTGEADGQPFEYEVKPGTQDTASIQAAMLVELLAGRSPTGFTILAGGKLGNYRYSSEGTARVSTAAGSFDTVIWASQRDGSSRVSRVWHAPSLGYVPVQAIQYRKGKAELQMKLASLQRP